MVHSTKKLLRSAKTKVWNFKNIKEAINKMLNIRGHKIDPLRKPAACGKKIKLPVIRRKKVLPVGFVAWEPLITNKGALPFLQMAHCSLACKMLRSVALKVWDWKKCSSWNILSALVNDVMKPVILVIQRDLFVQTRVFRNTHFPQEEVILKNHYTQNKSEITPEQEL